MGLLIEVWFFFILAFSWRRAIIFLLARSNLAVNLVILAYKFWICFSSLFLWVWSISLLGDSFYLISLMIFSLIYFSMIIIFYLSVYFLELSSNLLNLEDSAIRLSNPTNFCFIERLSSDKFSYYLYSIRYLSQILK